MQKQNPQMMAQMEQMKKHMQRNSGGTKDRLRAKLEARKAKNQSEQNNEASSSSS